MKINIDFDEIVRKNVNAVIDTSTSIVDKNPDSAGRVKQIEEIARISANVTVSILRDYHEMLENALDAIATTR